MYVYAHITLILLQLKKISQPTPKTFRLRCARRSGSAAATPGPPRHVATPTSPGTEDLFSAAAAAGGGWKWWLNGNQFSLMSGKTIGKS